MESLKVLAYLVGGGFILSFGANYFVKSASHLARQFGISPVIVGLTVVAFGTSAPELAVNVLAVMRGNTDIAMGNVVGSNVFNVAFILGLCALLKPLFVSAQLIRIDIPIMVGASIYLWVIAQDLQVSPMEGYVLFGGVIAYTVLQIRLAIKGKNAEAEFEKEFAEKGKIGKDSLILLAGLGALILGASLFVDGAVLGARLLGMSEAVIGLTIIAAGTSLPEVATSVAATLKGERDIAIGNVVGSNIFNILSVIGISSSVSLSPLVISPHMARVDILFMVLVSLFCLPFCLWRKQLDRPIGGILFLSWVCYTVYLVSVTN